MAHASPRRPRALGGAPKPLPIDGLSLYPLTTHTDPRGDFTELFRREWPGVPDPVQWSAVRSGAHTLRGMHVHVRHHDYLVVLHGTLRLGCRDLRQASPTSGASCTVTLRGERLEAVAIPPGVAHGFYFPEPALHVYAVTDYWRPEEELGCHWRDPELGIDWGDVASEPVLSERDAALPPLAELAAALTSRRALFDRA